MWFDLNSVSYFRLKVSIHIWSLVGRTKLLLAQASFLSQISRLYQLELGSIADDIAIVSMDVAFTHFWHVHPGQIDGDNRLAFFEAFAPSAPHLGILFPLVDEPGTFVLAPGFDCPFGRASWFWYGGPTAFAAADNKEYPLQGELHWESAWRAVLLWWGVACVMLKLVHSNHLFALR